MIGFALGLRFVSPLEEGPGFPYWVSPTSPTAPASPTSCSLPAAARQDGADAPRHRLCLGVPALLSACQAGQLAALIAQQPDLAAACAPGSLSTLHFCVLIKDATSIMALAAACAPLDGKLTLRLRSPELAKWINTLLQDAPSLANISRSEVWYGSGASPLSLALQLGQEAAAKALIDAAATSSLHFLATCHPTTQPGCCPT